MPGCVVKGCTNYDKKVNKQNDDISYHRFPTNPVIDEKWSRIIREQRPYFKSNAYLRICSAHFKPDDFYTTKSGLRKLKKKALPSITVQTFMVKDGDKRSSETKTETGLLVPKKEELADDDTSDLDSVIDSPRTVELKQKLEKCMLQNKTYKKTIKSLQKQNYRQKKKNESLTSVIEELKKRFLAQK